MSTPQNPYSGSDAENSDAENKQNLPTDQVGPDSDQAGPDFDQAQDTPVGDQAEAAQSAGSAQYGQGSQFSPSEQYSQAEQYNQQGPYGQQDSYGQQNQYDQSDLYNQQNQYAQTSQYYPQDQYGQPTQQGQYYQASDYAGYDQGNYAGSQHPPVGTYQQPAPEHSAGSNSGFFKSLFDFRFNNFIAVRWAGFIYIIAIVVAVLSWLGSIIGGILTGAAAGSASAYFGQAPSFSPWPLLLAIIFGWIIPALWVIFVRLALELLVSNVKTAENTKKIADSLGR